MTRSRRGVILAVTIFAAPAARAALAAAPLTASAATKAHFFLSGAECLDGLVERAAFLALLRLEVQPAEITLSAPAPATPGVALALRCERVPAAVRLLAGSGATATEVRVPLADVPNDARPRVLALALAEALRLPAFTASADADTRAPSSAPAPSPAPAPPAAPEPDSVSAPGASRPAPAATATASAPPPARPVRLTLAALAEVRGIPGPGGGGFLAGAAFLIGLEAFDGPWLRAAVGAAFFTGSGDNRLLLAPGGRLVIGVDFFRAGAFRFGLETRGDLGALLGPGSSSPAVLLLAGEADLAARFRFGAERRWEATVLAGAGGLLGAGLVISGGLQIARALR